MTILERIDEYDERITKMRNSSEKKNLTFARYDSQKADILIAELLLDILRRLVAIENRPART